MFISNLYQINFYIYFILVFYYFSTNFMGVRIYIDNFSGGSSLLRMTASTLSSASFNSLALSSCLDLTFTGVRGKTPTPLLLPPWWDQIRLCLFNWWFSAKDFLQVAHTHGLGESKWVFKCLLTLPLLVFLYVHFGQVALPGPPSTSSILATFPNPALIGFILWKCSVVHKWEPASLICKRLGLTISLTGSHVSSEITHLFITIVFC